MMLRDNLLKNTYVSPGNPNSRTYAIPKAYLIPWVIFYETGTMQLQAAPDRKRPSIGIFLGMAFELPNRA